MASDHDTLTTPEELVPGGHWFTLIRSAFQCLPFNVAVENAFARLKNMQRTSRGRNDVTYNIASKHVLSEIKAAHLANMQPIDSIDAVDLPQLTDPAEPDQHIGNRAEGIGAKGFG